MLQEVQDSVNAALTGLLDVMTSTGRRMVMEIAKTKALDVILIARRADHGRTHRTARKRKTSFGKRLVEFAARNARYQLKGVLRTLKLEWIHFCAFGLILNQGFYP